MTQWSTVSIPEVITDLYDALCGRAAKSFEDIKEYIYLGQLMQVGRHNFRKETDRRIQ